MDLWINVTQSSAFPQSGSVSERCLPACVREADPPLRTGRQTRGLLLRIVITPKLNSSILREIAEADGSKSQCLYYDVMRRLD
jgi:hypothetical protein